MSQGRINPNQNPAFVDGGTGGGGGGGGYSTIEDNSGAALTQRTILQFGQGLTAIDQVVNTLGFIDTTFANTWSVGQSVVLNSAVGLNVVRGWRAASTAAGTQNSPAVTFSGHVSSDQSALHWAIYMAASDFAGVGGLRFSSSLDENSWTEGMSLKRGGTLEVVTRVLSQELDQTSAAPLVIGPTNATSVTLHPSVTFEGGATASGAVAFDLSGSSGAFKFPTAGISASFTVTNGISVGDSTHRFASVFADIINSGATNTTLRGTSNGITLANGGSEVVLKAIANDLYLRDASNNGIAIINATQRIDFQFSAAPVAAVNGAGQWVNLTAGNETTTATGGANPQPTLVVGFLSFKDSGGTVRKLPYYAI